MKTNYHTHSEYCGHAEGTLNDYIKKACSLGLTALGFSEHAPFPGDPFGMRMPFNMLPNYVKELCSLRKHYADKISLHIGLEAEYLPMYESYYPMLLSDYDIEYMIMGQHFFIGPDGRCYNLYDNSFPSEYLISHSKNMIQGMQTGYFKYIAHPDLMFIRDFSMDANCMKAISILVDGSAQGDFILELNANGFRRGKHEYSDGLRYQYPVDIFWKEVANAHIPVIIGSDCHSHTIICDKHTEYAKEYADTLGLNLLDKLDI